MMRRLFSLTCTLLAGTVAMAQQNFSAALIDKDLLPYASAVVRNEQVTVEVKELDNTIYHIKKAITVLNKNGDDLAHMVVYHDKSNIIKYIKGAVYNEFGQQQGKFSEKDFEDVSAADNFSLFEDARVKHYIPSVTVYPYTIEYEYEVRLKQTLNLPDWEPNPAMGLAVEKSSYSFICKPDFTIRYKEINIPAKVVESKGPEGQKVYTWQLANLKAVKHEPYSPYYKKYRSTVKIAPEKFMYEGLSGSFTNWQELGKWCYDKLLYNRDNLPAETVNHIKELTAGITDPKLKAKKIYEYMQQKTHYISVQIGIGGYQPFTATEVDNLNYGDCKALVNYTKALLKSVDIDSYYCVVKSGDAYKVSIQNDFASMDQGDHVILCVPFKNDTTWLECTSQQIPFGFLGEFTDDRTVLACTPQGGILLHTPKYTAQTNLEKRTADFVITEAGELDGSITTAFKGTQYENREGVVNEAREERIKQIKNIYPINNLEIEKLEYKQDKNALPVTTETIQLKARDYGTMAEGKYYFLANPVNRVSTPQEVRNRQLPVDIERGYTDEDEISYTLPAGYHTDKSLLTSVIDKPFGHFSATITINGNKLIYKRKLQVIDGTYNKDMYQDLVDFFDDVSTADHYSVRLVKGN